VSRFEEAKAEADHLARLGRPRAILGLIERSTSISISAGNLVLVDLATCRDCGEALGPVRDPAESNDRNPALLAWEQPPGWVFDRPRNAWILPRRAGRKAMHRIVNQDAFGPMRTRWHGRTPSVGGGLAVHLLPQAIVCPRCRLLQILDRDALVPLNGASRVVDG